MRYLATASPNPRRGSTAQLSITAPGAAVAERCWQPQSNRRAETRHGFTAVRASWLTLAQVRDRNEIAKK